MKDFFTRLLSAITKLANPKPSPVFAAPESGPYQATDIVKPPQPAPAPSVSKPMPIPEAPVVKPPVKPEVPIVKGSPEFYLYHWNKAQVLVDYEVEQDLMDVIKAIVRSQRSYAVVERATGVPWQLVACLHYRESGLDFKACLANGEYVVGDVAVALKKKTKLVPKGRGPYHNWEESAVDAIHYDGLDAIKTWSIARILQAAERFNGLGYLHNNLEMSPYVWAGTNIYDGIGKYSSDGKYDPKAKEDQLGVAAILKRLQALKLLGIKEI